MNTNMFFKNKFFSLICKWFFADRINKFLSILETVKIVIIKAIEPANVRM